jgi:hypothetical protein
MPAARSRPPNVRSMFRSLDGLPPPIVGNLVAIQLGLGTARAGWTQREITGLVWIRWLRETGQLAS